MQQTALDRWLKRRFVLVTRIATLRPAPEKPRGIRFCELPEKPGQRYRFIYTTGSEKQAQRFIEMLKSNNQMFTTEVFDRDAWYVKLIAPPGKSLTWNLISFALIAVSVASALWWVGTLVVNPEMREHFRGALEVLKM